MRPQIKIHPIDFNKNIAVGLSFNLDYEDNTFFKLNYLTFDQVRTNLQVLLSTKKGERVMRPDYGTNLMRLLFEQDNTVDGEIINEISESVSKWMPNVVINNINIDKDSDNNTVYVNVQFTTKANTNQSGTVTIELS